MKHAISLSHRIACRRPGQSTSRSSLDLRRNPQRPEHCGRRKNAASCWPKNEDGTADMSWTIGKVKITKIVELETIGSTRFILPLAGREEIRRLPWLIPDFATGEGRLKMSIHSLVVETPKQRIVVDTGLGNAKQGRGVPTWNNRNGPFLKTLTDAGFAPESIDTVLCTHLHVDHVGWNTKLVDGKWVPTFPKARYLFGKIEYEHWRDRSNEPSQAAAFNDSVKPIMDAGKAELIASDAQLTDEIRMIPTTGHSPGHMSLHIASEGAEGLLTGDVAHHPCQMAHLDWSSAADFDPVQSTATRRELFSRLADRPVLVVGGHFDAGHIKRDGEAFRYVASG
jgi:glyoxylase-like metal-dependent hydrolase (beta-lactamase superfamily II)